MANRRHFEEVYGGEWRRAERTGDALSLLLIDVDDFKSYNDHEGHRAGDIVLAAVAESLRGGLQRAGDLVARYGGEEFAVLLPATNLNAASAQTAAPPGGGRATSHSPFTCAGGAFRHDQHRCRRSHPRSR